MRKRCRLETRGLMANDAIFVGGYMVIVFASYSCTIVTNSAVIHYVLVIKIGLRK